MKIEFYNGVFTVDFEPALAKKTDGEVSFDHIKCGKDVVSAINAAKERGGGPNFDNFIHRLYDIVKERKLVNDIPEPVRHEYGWS